MSTRIPREHPDGLLRKGYSEHAGLVCLPQPHFERLVRFSHHPWVQISISDLSFPLAPPGNES
jgi:hypothetical protein